MGDAELAHGRSMRSARRKITTMYLRDDGRRTVSRAPVRRAQLVAPFRDRRDDRGALTGFR